MGIHSLQAQEGRTLHYPSDLDNALFALWMGFLYTPIALAVCFVWDRLR